MTDYGHDLILGTFITPQNQRRQDVVGLAQLTERAGLDLVTFMDHPYNPGFPDTWTLVSYVAAQTERVHLSGYVLNLPSRHPAYLAKAAASLDLRTRRGRWSMSRKLEFVRYGRPRDVHRLAAGTARLTGSSPLEPFDWDDSEVGLWAVLPDAWAVLVAPPFEQSVRHLLRDGKTYAFRFSVTARDTDALEYEVILNLSASRHGEDL